MPKVSPAASTLPLTVAASLRRLGADLSTARKRRKQTQREWAERLNVSIPTLLRMEKGDPTVSMAVYATALWMIGRHEALAGLAAPRDDVRALEADVQQAQQRYSRRGRHDGQG